MYREDKNYFVYPYNAVSAVNQLSLPGYISYGPYITLPAGNYEVEFLVRSTPLIQGPIANLSVVAGNTTYVAQELHSNNISVEQYDKWIRKKLRFNLGQNTNNLEVKVY